MKCTDFVLWLFSWVFILFRLIDFTYYCVQPPFFQRVVARCPKGVECNYVYLATIISGHSNKIIVNTHCMHIWGNSLLIFKSTCVHLENDALQMFCFHYSICQFD